MGKEIDWEIRGQAEELYIIDGRTYEQVAEATGVSVSQLKAWGSAGGWRKKREECRESVRDIRMTKVKLRRAQLRKALETQDPQDVYAAVRLESLAARESIRPDAVAPDIDRPKTFLEDMEFIAATLKEIDPQGLKVLAKNFDTIVDRFKQKHAQTSENH